MVVCRLCQADIVSVTTAVRLILMPGHYCCPINTIAVLLKLLWLKLLSGQYCSLVDTAL